MTGSPGSISLDVAEPRSALQPGSRPRPSSSTRPGASSTSSASSTTARSRTSWSMPRAPTSCSRGSPAWSSRSGVTVGRMDADVVGAFTDLPGIVLAGPLGLRRRWRLAVRGLPARGCRAGLPRDRALGTSSTLPTVDPLALEALRIAAWRPDIRDTDEKSIPHELGLAALRRSPHQGLLPRPGDGREGAQPRPPAAPPRAAAPRRCAARCR